MRLSQKKAAPLPLTRTSKSLKSTKAQRQKSALYFFYKVLQFHLAFFSLKTEPLSLSPVIFFIKCYNFHGTSISRKTATLTSSPAINTFIKCYISEKTFFNKKEPEKPARKKNGLLFRNCYNPKPEITSPSFFNSSSERVTPFPIF